MSRLLKYLLLLTLPLYLLDQVSKEWVVREFEPPPAPYTDPVSGLEVVPNGSLERHVVIENFFTLVRVHNRGVAFGMFAGSGGANWFFGILSVSVLTVVLVLWSRGKLGTTPISSVAAALLCTGILGNLSDRLRLGYVVDFLDFQFGNYHWPSFNVADSCICIAAVLLFLSSFRETQISSESAAES